MERLYERRVGYDRFAGEHAYRQLTELYRALRLYVNCFQPSMKLQSKQRDGKKVRCVYDRAKTPLQRLLLSGVLSAQKQRELTEFAQALDPISLFQQLEQLQQAVFRSAVSCSPLVQTTPSAPIRVFSLERCTAGTLQVSGSIPNPVAVFYTLYQEQERRKRVLGWRRNQKDPFEGEWEHIMSWLVAIPERSRGDIFRELQHLAPGRYQPSHIRILQQGMWKIRVHLLEIFEEQWQEEVIHGRLLATGEPFGGCSKDFLTIKRERTRIIDHRWFLFRRLSHHVHLSQGNKLEKEYFVSRETRFLMRQCTSRFFAPLPPLPDLCCCERLWFWQCLVMLVR